VKPRNSRVIKTYFAPFPTPAMLMAGGSIAAMCWWGASFAFGLWFFALAASAWPIVAWSRRPSDHEMDGWTDEIMTDLIPRSLEKSDLDPSETIRDPVSIVSPRLRDRGGAFFGLTRGRDRQIRYTPIHATVINFTQHQIVIYQCALDLTTGKPLNEGVDEYFYHDVVSVATQSQSWTFTKEELGHELLSRCPGIKRAMTDDSLQLNSAETFVLTTSGATSVRVVLKDPQLIACLGGGELTTEGADQATKAVRKMLREKKAQ
jgi:hypothetical protein